jgi:hypothetical protein
MSFDEYIDSEIQGGYISEHNFEPLRCQHCEGSNLEDTGHIIEELGTHVVTEYYKRCKDCDKEIGYWSYGYWQI